VVIDSSECSLKSPAASRIGRFWKDAFLVSWDEGYADSVQNVIRNRARGYGILVASMRIVTVTASAAFSQGALISSVLDMVKWDAALNSEGLLKKTSLDQMWTPVSLKDGTISKYGFGWFSRPVPGHKTVAHGGELPGFSTFIWRFIDDKLTVIVLSNCETADTGRIALGVAALYSALLSPEVKSSFSAIAEPISPFHLPQCRVVNCLCSGRNEF